MDVRVATNCKCGAKGELSYMCCDDDIPPQGTVYECWICDAVWLAPPTLIDWSEIIKSNNQVEPEGASK